MTDRDGPRIFEDARPKLLWLAYRILGSLADAEDAVQDTLVKWMEADRNKIESPSSWLTTVCTRRCLDLLRAARRKRVSYTGAWLPEPVHTPVPNEAEARVELASSLTTAFLLMLERLTPKERAAYLLREIFDVPYPELAQTLALREDACRKLVSRAKANIDQDRIRHTTPLETQNRLLSAFRAAISEGATARLTRLLSDDIRLSADSGGKVPAPLEPLAGVDEVVPFLSEVLRNIWGDYQWIVADINGARGFVLKHEGATAATVSFAFDGAGRATDIYIVRNPKKLAGFRPIAIN